MIYKTNSAQETQKIAAEFAKQLKNGDIVTLDGDLGAGKTAFTSGIAQAFGIKDIVSSPTFTVVNEYLSGKMPLFHFDVYRLESGDDLYDIGWEDYLNRGGVCVIEWAKRVSEIFDSPVYEVIIKKNLDISEEYREITIEHKGGAL